MSMNAIIGAFELGLIYALLALGIFISFRILNIPDLSVDGTFILGVAVSVMYTVNGHPYLGIIMAILAGALAGIVTGFLQTKMNVQPILAGILTMTALYTINLRIMKGRPNIHIGKAKTIFTSMKEKLPREIYAIVVAGVIILFVSFVLFLFLKTQLGMSLRATGDNEHMVRATSISSDAMKILGFAIANGLVALSGGVLGQYQNFADANGGIGMLVAGLASIIIGETVFGRRSVLSGILAAVFGSLIYRLLFAFAIEIGMEAIDLKLFSALIVAITISLPNIKKYIKKFIGGIKNA